MPLGIVDDKEFQNELDNNSKPRINEELVQPRASIPTINAEILDAPTVGRTPEVNNVPQSLRKVLGEDAAVNGLQSAMKLADSFGGLSQPTLSTYANGKVSPGKNNISPSSDDLNSFINNRKNKISKKALNKINLALTLMDEEKLLGCDAKELSSVAKDMAVVVKQMEPKEKEEKQENVQFHFYAPQIRNEQHYDVVVAKDNY